MIKFPENHYIKILINKLRIAFVDLYQELINEIVIVIELERGRGTEETTNLQFSMVFGRNARRFPETLRTLSLDKQPIEFGRDFS